MNMNRVDTEIRRELLYGKCFVGAGIASAALAAMVEEQRLVFVVLAIGFAVVGGLIIYSFRKARTDPELLAIFAASRDERKRAINAEAGMLSYRGMYFVALALVVVDLTTPLGTQRALLFLLVYMMVSDVLFRWMVGRRH
jgi:hypothetical protein